MAKILIIDDEPGMQQVLNKVLTPQGHQIITADDGVKAVSLFSGMKPDMVLMDTALADMDGADILAGIKKIRKNIPVVVLAGIGDVESARELVSMGANDYISKPFKIEDLVNIVNKHVSGGAKKPAPEQPSGKSEAPASVSPAAKKAGKKIRPVVLVAGAIAALVLAGGGYFAFLKINAGPPDAKFSAGYSSASALCWDGKYLWAGDWTEEALYKFQTAEKFSLAEKISLPGNAVTGIAYDGANIWTCNSFECTITKHQADKTLTVGTVYKAPGPSPSGLCFDGERLWSLDFQQNKIFKHKMDKDLSVESAYDSPAKGPHGIFAWKGEIYVSESKTGKIFRLSKSTLSITGIYVLKGMEKPANPISGMACDGKSIWLCQDSDPAIYRKRMSDVLK